MGGSKMIALALIVAGLVGTGNAIPKASKFNYDHETGVISLVENPTLRLNAAGGKMANGDPLVLYPDSAQSHEMFEVTDSQIKLQHAPGMCLNAEGGVGAGAKIVTWHCGGEDEVVDHEKFVFGADGRIRLEKHDDHCINVEGGALSMGGQLILYPCSDSDFAPNEIFVYVDGQIRPKSHPDLHFNVKGGDLSTSAPVVLWAKQAAAHESFEFFEGRLRMKFKPEMCVNAEEGVGNGHRLILWPCSLEGAAENELFEYDDERKVIFSKHESGSGFNVKEGNLSNGAEIILWPLDQMDHEEL